MASPDHERSGAFHRAKPYKKVELPLKSVSKEKLFQFYVDPIFS